MIYGYIRVSTDTQTVENQRFEIMRLCQKQNLTVDGWIDRRKHQRDKKLQQTPTRSTAQEGSER